MKKLVLTLLMMICSASLAESNCPKATRLTTAFLQSSLAQQTNHQSDKLQDQFESSAWPTIRKFENTPNNTSEFTCMVNLAVASSPWDFDSAGAAYVASKLGEPNLKAAYEAALDPKKFPNQCRAEAFRNLVDLNTCMGPGDGANTSNQTLSTCQKRFPPPNQSLKDCELGRSGKTEKKSPNEVAADDHCPKGTQTKIRHSGTPGKLDVTNGIAAAASPSNAQGIAQNKAARPGAPLDITSPAQKAGRSRGPASVGYSQINDDAAATASE